MKILSFYLLFCGFTYATSWAPLEFPQEPTAAQLLEKNELAGVTEEVLSQYLETHWEDAGCWIPYVTDREQEKISNEFFRHIELKDGEADAYLKAALTQLQVDRLADPRRIVDATIRELGRRGTGNSLLSLLGQLKYEEREWVRWKALTSVQEILSRENPNKLDDRVMHLIPANLVAPLLRDLDPGLADIWAWALWENQKKFLSVSFRSNVRLRTRIWLASAFARSHHKEASDVFREGLQSHDAAVRTATEMTIRSCVGGSLPYSSSLERLSESILNSKWNPVTPIWGSLPLPLERPLLRRSRAGRTDLIWLSGDAKIVKNTDDVWPLIRDPLTNGSFYSEVGDYSPMEYGLTDTEGILHSRIPNLSSTPTLARHGGLWALVSDHHAVEFHADGSKLWECPLKVDYRKIAPISGGRVILLSYQSIECRNRRGDPLWKIKLSLDDPRDIIPVDDDRFLLSCTKSIGWLTPDGKYDPVLGGLKSAGWIRYHPAEPWIIFDGGDSTAIIFDPKTGKETGRIDLDDGWGYGKSRFPFPPGYFPE